MKKKMFFQIMTRKSLKVRQFGEELKAIIKMHTVKNKLKNMNVSQSADRIEYFQFLPAHT